MRKLPVLVSDMDGTLVNLMDEAINLIWDALHVPLTPEDCTYYDVTRSFLPKLRHKLDGKALDDCLRKHVWDNPEVYRSARPYWSMHQAYQAWLAAKGDIVFVTGRPDTKGVIAATKGWLRDWGYTSCGVCFSSTYAGGKAQVLRDEVLARGTEVWVAEDDTRTAKAMAEVLAGDMAKGLGVSGAVYLVSRPWTQNTYGGLLEKRYLEQDMAERIEESRP